MKRIIEKVKEIRRQIPDWTLERELAFLKGESKNGEFDLGELDFTDLPNIFDASDVVIAYGEDVLLDEIPIGNVCSYYGTDEILDELGDLALDRLEANGLVVVPDDDELVSNLDPYDLVKAACNAVEGGCKSKDDLKRIACRIVDDCWDGKYTK